MALYELALLGNPTQEQLTVFERNLQLVSANFQLSIGDDISVHIQPDFFKPNMRSASAAIFFGGTDTKNIDIHSILDISSIPLLPVASASRQRSAEIPDDIGSLNCMFYDRDGPDRIFSAFLECLDLLPKQRRIFLSYRREESTPVALQLFAELSSRHFNVFLDTHSIGPAVDFQEELWHQLCDVDVLIMLETPGYFESRWTTIEFGRALAKGMGILQIQWPDSTPSSITGTSSRVELLEEEITISKELSTSAIDRICLQLEQVRTLSHAVRHVSVVTSVTNAVKTINGKIDGMGPNKAIYLTLKNGQQFMVQPHIGIPDAITLQSTIERADTLPSAVVYDHLGLKPSWMNHIAWLGSNVNGAKWVKASEAAWEIAGLHIK